MLAGGCGKKDNANTDSDTGNTSIVEQTDNTEESEDIKAPVKEEYKVSDYITLGEYKGIEVTVDKLEVTEEDVDTAIKADLEAKASDKEVTGRPVKEGDIVNIDYEGLKDGVAFDGGTAQGYDLEIGSGSFIPGFEDGLIGANVGDKLDLDITFPEDYPTADLAGQPVVFKVTVNAIKETVVPELTEEFVKENTEFDSVEAYRESNRVTLEEENKVTMEQDKVNKVFLKILENSTIKSVPQTLIDYYIYEMTSYYTQYAAMFGVDFDGFLSASGITKDEFDTKAKEYAETMGKQELVINAIIEKEGFELSEDEYKDGLAKLVEDYGYESEEELLENADEAKLKESLLWQKVSDYVVEQSVEI